MHPLRPFLLWTTLCMSFLAAQKVCVKLDREEVNNGKYNSEYAGFSFMVVAVSETSVLLWMKAIRRDNGIKKTVSGARSISSIICRCLSSTMYWNIHSIAMNIDNFRCPEAQKISASSSVASISRSPSNDTAAFANPKATRGNPDSWRLTIQRLKELFFIHGSITNPKAECFYIDRQRSITRLNDDWKGAILDTWIDHEQKIYILWVRIMHTPSMEAYSKNTNILDIDECNSLRNQSAGTSYSILYKTDSDLEMLYASFGGDISIKTKEVYRPFPCLYVDERADEFLNNLHHLNTEKLTYEVVAHIQGSMLLSLSGHWSYRSDTMKLIKIVKGHLNQIVYEVSELVCDRVSYLKELPVTIATQHTRLSLDATGSAEQELQHPTIISRNCYKAKLTYLHLCRRRLGTIKNLGTVIVYFNVESSSWIICLEENLSSLNLLTPLCGDVEHLDNFQSERVSIPQSAFKNLLQVMYLGVDESNNILNVLKKHQLPNFNGNIYALKSRTFSELGNEATVGSKIGKRQRKNADTVQGKIGATKAKHPDSVVVAESAGQKKILLFGVNIADSATSGNKQAQ